MSRVFRYQPSLNAANGLQQVVAWIAHACETDLQIQQLKVKSLDLVSCYKAARIILAANMHLPELNMDDFEEWFADFSTAESIELRSTDEAREPSKFAKLLAKCTCKASHLSVPIQTFVPVSL